jgi:predicted RNA-binding Zn-ribbon protein involved in translation (DUF1610 family)
MTANHTNKKSGFYIGVTCPGCGGELEIQSGFFVLTCAHCGSPLRIKMPDMPPAYLIRSNKSHREIRFLVDRFLKKNALPLTGRNLDIKAAYVPYWKIDAVALKVRNKIIERYAGYRTEDNQEITYDQKTTDIRLTPFSTTQIACDDLEQMPFSLGMRTEYLRMVPFSKENIPGEFVCLPAVRPWQQVLNDIDRNIESLGSIATADFGKNRTEIFHPTGSIVYFPFYVVESSHRDKSRQFLVDGVSGRVLRHSDDLAVNLNIESATARALAFGDLRVEFHRCPTCGIDLPGEQSYVYICDNCRDLVLMEKFPYTIEDIAMVDFRAGPADRMFPFWSMRLSEDEKSRVRSMFGGIYGSDRLVIPAFKVPDFEAMFRLSKRISAAVPKMELVRIDRLDNHFVRVDRSLSETLIMADIIIYRESIRKGIEHSVHESKFRPGNVSLFYAPFHPESYFYVDSLLGAVTFEKSLAP